MISPFERFAGCFLGGAVGDALGAPVEFLSNRAIRERFGPGGIRDFAPAYGRVGAITDDTQMALFTAEGLLRAWARQADRGLCNVSPVVHRAYLRWLTTQNGSAPDPYRMGNADGWLIGITALHSQRAPGNTCLLALQSSRLGTLEEPLNNSKGCGGVMRSAPVGLMVSDDPEQAFHLGCEIAAITHGHPSGYLAAGYIAALIAWLVQGESLLTAVDRCGPLLSAWKGHEEVSAAVDAALELSRAGSGVENLVKLGKGWVAEEALGMSLYCCLAADDFEDAVILAVNHSGDSDSTGAITGNILGTALGMAAIPKRWSDAVELREETLQVAQDMVAVVGAEDPCAIYGAMSDRYPPN